MYCKICLNFRATVYYSNLKRQLTAAELTPGKQIECSKVSGKCGLTLELCAGIVDKDIPLIEIAKEEILEECGYDVPLENIEHVQQLVGSVGIAGDPMNMFYAEVTDQMRVRYGN